MIDAGRQNQEVSLGNFNPYPLVVTVSNIKVTTASQDEADFFVGVQMLLEECLYLKAEAGDDTNQALSNWQFANCQHKFKHTQVLKYNATLHDIQHFTEASFVTVMSSPPNKAHNILNKLFCTFYL